jgi:uncharacterized repeat protein (TIGR01451 family)
MEPGWSRGLKYNVTVLKPSDLTLQSWIIHNDVMVTSDTYDPDPSNNVFYEDTTVINTYFLSDLKVRKISKPDNIMQVGGLVNYTIIIENLGPSTAHNVSVRDEIFSSNIFTVLNVTTISGGNYSFSITPPVTGQLVTIEGTRDDSTMELGERDIIQVTVQADNAQDINNLVNVFCQNFSRWVDPDKSNNEALNSIRVREAGTTLDELIGLLSPPTGGYILLPAGLNENLTAVIIGLLSIVLLVLMKNRT